MTEISLGEKIIIGISIIALVAMIWIAFSANRDSEDIKEKLDALGGTEPEIHIYSFEKSIKTLSPYSIEFYCNKRNYTCSWYKKRNETKDYFYKTIFISNRGKKAHNLRIEMICRGIEYYGLISDYPLSIEHNYAIVGGGCRIITKMDELDAILLYSIDLIHLPKINENLNCSFEYSYDELDGSIKKEGFEY